MKIFRLVKNIFTLAVSFGVISVGGQLFSQVLEVEDMAIKTAGTPISGGWLLDVEGYVADTVNFSSTGYYSLTIRAKGTKYDNEWPFMEASIDNLVCGPVVVDKTYWQNYTSYSYIHAGNRQLSLSFINDLSTRGLSLDRLTISSVVFEEEDWLISLAQSIMSRFPDPASYSITSWQFEELMWGIAKAYEITGNADYLNYVRTYLDDHVDASGNLDCGAEDLIPGILLVWLFENTGEQKFLQAAVQVGEYMLTEYPRTSEGGYVHLEDLVDQLWDDTLGGIGRFLGKMGQITDDPRYFDEGINQFVIHASHLQDPVTGLFYHGWDEDGSADWATMPNNCSPCFWARGNGWIIRALTEFLEFLPADYSGRNSLLTMLNRLVAGLAQYQDLTSGLWYTVIDRGGDGVNYVETAGSTLIAYGMQKAINLGCLGGGYQQTVDRANEGLYRKVYKKENNEIVVTGVSAGTGPGDYNNYVLKPVRTGYDYPYGDGVFLQEKSEMVRQQTGTTVEISGRVLYYSNNNPIKDVNLMLSGGRSATEISNLDGYYQFTNLPANLNYTVRPDKLTDSDVGAFDITTYDAALTAQAAVALITLTDGQLVAADVNRDDHIFAFDAALIAQYAVGLPKLSGTFVGAWTFSPDSIAYENLSNDQGDQDYTGILLGNVHGNWSGAGSYLSKEMTYQNYEQLTDIHVEPGGELALPVEMPGLDEIISAEIEVSFDPEILMFVALKKQRLQSEAEVLYLPTENRVKIGIYCTTALPKNSELLRLIFRATDKKNQTGKLALDRFLLNEQFLLTGEANIFVDGSKPLPDKFDLSQNYPNPFTAKEGTTINFDLPRTSKVNLAIYNLVGQLVTTMVETDLPAGSHAIKWDGRDNHGVLSASGIYFYQLIAGEQMFFRKLLFLR